MVGGSRAGHRWAGFLLAGGLAVAGATVTDTARAEEAVKITAKAKAHFKAGVAFLQDPGGARFEEAYQQFRAAYLESPSWKILGNLGIAAMNLERDGEAIEAFDEYLKKGGDKLGDGERAQFQRDLDTLKAAVVWVTVKGVPEGATLTDARTPVSGNVVSNLYRDFGKDRRIGIRPGRHAMKVRLEGYEPATWEFDAVTGEEVEHTFELEKVKEEPKVPAGGGEAGQPRPDEPPGPRIEKVRPVPTGVWVGVAATGALAIGAGVVGVLALGNKSDFDDANDGTDPTAAQSLADDGQTLNLVTDVLIAGAVVAAGVTAVLYFTRPTIERPIAGSEKERRHHAWQVTPMAGRDSGGLMLSGTF